MRSGSCALRLARCSRSAGANAAMLLSGMISSTIFVGNAPRFWLTIRSSASISSRSVSGRHTHEFHVATGKSDRSSTASFMSGSNTGEA